MMQAVVDPLHRAFCTRAYLPAVRWRKRIPYGSILREALRNERLPVAELRQLQLGKLRALVEHARINVPFYRDRLVDPDSIRTLDDVRRIPVLEKRDIAEHGERLRSSAWIGRVFPAVTSGSTGVALRFAVDSRHAGWVEAVQERGQAWWGVQPGDRAVILWGRPVDGPASAQWRIWFLYRLRNRIAFNTFEELDGEFLDRIADRIIGFKPKLLYGYGSSLGALAAHLDRAGRVLPPESAPRVVQFTGDHMYEAEQAIASRVFRAPVASVYGSSEGGGTAQPCARFGQHLSVDHILTEFVSADGTPAAPGEPAEILLTTLHNFAMPLIRYRIGDVGSWNERPCDCGVTLPLMNLDVGKLADLIHTSSRQRVSPYVLDYLNKHLLRTGVRGIGQFLVEQTGTDDFVLHVVREDPFDPRSVEFFTRKMKEYLGETIRTEVRFRESIPVSASGKRRWFQKSIP